MKKLIDRIRCRVINDLSLSNREVINGKKIIIPYIAGIQSSLTEPWMEKVLQKLLPYNPGVFVDVGVNLGQTLIKVKALDESREYLGFEPNPACLFYTNQVIEINKFKGCTLIPTAITLRTGLGTLYSIQNSAVDAAATIIQDFRPEHGIARKEYIPLYDLRKNSKNIDILLKKIGIIKIDVEGAELDVIESMQEIIQRDFPALIIEILPVYKDNQRIERRGRQDRLESLMRSWGYSFYRIQDKSAEQINYQLVENIGVHDELEWSDYVLIHEGKKHVDQDTFR